MANRTTAAVLAALVTLAGGAGAAIAQDAATSAQPATDTPAATQTEAPAEAPAAASTEAAPAAQSPAPTEAPAAEAGEPKVGQPYAKSTHGDWTLRCMKTESGKDPCELYQLMKDKNDSPVAEASVLPMKGDVSAVITFVAPLETDLQAGLGLQVDNGKDARYPFMLCAPVGCISRIGMKDSDLAPLKRGKSATVSVLPFGAGKDELVKLPLSLSGFTAGMEALIAANKDVTAETPKQ